MTEAKKPTPTQRIKELEVELHKAQQALLKLNQHHGEQLAKYGNEQYSLGDAEGYNRGREEMEAAFKAQSVIQRWMYKG